MYIYLSKILPHFLMPLTLSLLLGVAALVTYWSGRRFAGNCLLASALLVIWAASTPMVADGLYGHLESRFPPESMASVPSSRCIVVLGGAIGLPIAPRFDMDLAESVDRVYKAAQLYREGKGIRVFVTGGNQPWTKPGPSEASLIGELLVEWGVPADAIQLEGLSRNTRENALNIKPMLISAGCDQSLLVTSAAHMPRAFAAFRAVELEVYPVSTDVRVTRVPGISLRGIFPDAGSLAMTTDAIREYMGLAVYRIRGWN